jgi:UDP-2-acetamido-3-amino-2,3-dideoxy-glucuronate N-acetyltransferase
MAPARVPDRGETEMEPRSAGPPSIHPTAVVEEGAKVGDDARIWHFAHIRDGAHIGASTVIGKSVYVDKGVEIGRHCKIENFVSVYAGVTLADEVFVGPSVAFTNDRAPRATGKWEIATTLVEHGASIGANATIVCGATIGAWAMVGAGSVVTKDVPPHTLVVGNPAHPIGWVCRCGNRVEGPGSVCGVCGRLLQIS